MNMRRCFLELIVEREAEHARAGRPAHIIGKLNQLEDRAVCSALIEASRAGVEIDLIVRGFCILAPGVPGATERVRITSVIGRFLEHSRIYYFRNGAAEPLGGDFYIGSADWMRRNLSERVEAVTPIETPALRERLWEILQTLLHDRRQGWDLRAGRKVRSETTFGGGADEPGSIGTHQTLMDLTRAAAPERVQGDGRRNRGIHTDSNCFPARPRRAAPGTGNGPHVNSAPSDSRLPDCVE